MKDTEYILVMFDVDKPTEELNVLKKRVTKDVYEQVKATKTAILEVDGKSFKMEGAKFVGFGNAEKGFSYIAVIDVKVYEGPIKANA